MSFSITYPFDTPDNYVYDNTKVTDPNGAVMLKRQADSHELEEAFDADTGFTYDNTKAEITGGKLQQKDTRPVGSTLYASFTIDEDSDWGGNLNNSLSGGAVVDAGKIDLTGATGKILNMPGSGGNFDGVSSAGCIRFDMIPNYNGSPSLTNQILEFDASDGNNGAIFISHLTNGTFSIDLRDSVGAAHSFTTSIVSGVSGVPMTIELNFDFDSTSRFFVDGVQKGSLSTSPYTRGASPGTFKWGGASGLGDFWIDNIILFNAVQHTSSHTGELPFAYNSVIYVKSIVELPAFSHTGTGFITSLDNFSTTEFGALLFNLKAGSSNWKWFDGANWVDSNGTDSEANTVAEMNLNISSFTDIYGELNAYIKIFFTNNSNTQSYIEILSINHTDLEEYATDNPKITPVASVFIDGVVSITGTTVEPGADSITYTISVDGIEKYFDGAGWVNSSGYPQTNTEVDVNANAATLLIPLGGDVIIIPHMHTDDGSTTPSISNLILTYDTHGALPSIPGQCLVYGYFYNNQGDPVPNVTVAASLVSVSPYNNEILITKNIKEVKTDSVGYWEISLIENASMPAGVGYTFKFSGAHTNISYNRVVPNEPVKNFLDLEEL